MNKQLGLCVRSAFLVAGEVNLAVKEASREKNPEHSICIGANRRKIIILSASDPWKYLVRAKKNHETDLRKT